MDKDTNQENPSLLSIKQESPRKLAHINDGNNNSSGINAATTSCGGGNGGNDRLKRDEWSEGAVSTLLEAYESKWILRNRAKLKGHDWEDVARHVSSRSNFTKSPKTQTQCKNKIESMKKRYRSESAAADASSWPLYPRLDLLLRGTAATAAPPPPPPPPLFSQPLQQQLTPPPPLFSQPLQQQLTPPPLPTASAVYPQLMLLEQSLMPQQPPPTVVTAPPVPPPPPLSAPQVLVAEQNSLGSNGVDRGAKEDGVEPELSDHVSDKNNAMEDSDSSTPALYTDKEKLMRSKKQKMKMEKRKMMMKRRKEQIWEIGDSIRWLAEVVVRSEQSRMDTMREIEKMRIEAEAKRGEMDLKRTEIVANTQLEIAKLFAGVISKGSVVDSSLRIGRN